MMFAQANSEHCRHKIFNATWTIDGLARDRSLFQMIKNTYALHPDGVLSAYRDNAAVLVGAPGGRFWADPATGEGRRKSVDRHDLLQMGLSENLLSELEKTYLIRRELNTVGGFSFEISHDTLVLPIQKAKKNRQALEEQERLQQEQIEKEKQLAEERRKLRRATGLALAGLVLTAIALVAALLAMNQTRKANDNAKVAVEALLKVAQDAVYHLAYEEALPSLQAAAKLGQNKTKVAQALQEIAFVRLESGQKLSEAADLIFLIGNLLGKTKPMEPNSSPAQMRQTLKSLDANHYNELMGRYFPVMLSVSKGTFQMGCDSGLSGSSPFGNCTYTGSSWSMSAVIKAPKMSKP
jgi:hypothetical protein